MHHGVKNIYPKKQHVTCYTFFETQRALEKIRKIMIFDSRYPE